MTDVFRSLHMEITENGFKDGTAAMVVMIEQDHSRMIIANAGDQRAVLARKKILPFH